MSTPFCSLEFLRFPREPHTTALLSTRTVVDPVSRHTRQYGSRQLIHPATRNADALTVMGLTGQSLLLHTADGDASFTLTDSAGRTLWSHNACGMTSSVCYETATGGGRLLGIVETEAGGAGRVREQFAYAPLSTPDWKARNMAGALVEHRNNAGINSTLNTSLTGQPVQSQRCLLKPDIGLPDWRAIVVPDTETPVFTSYITDATGATVCASGTAGITLLTTYNICGDVQSTGAQYTEKAVVINHITFFNIQYQADGKILSKTAGNGVQEMCEFDPRTQYLSRHLTQRPAGHPLGKLIISDLYYTYDAAGNILTLTEDGSDPVWHNNIKITGLRTYEYDTLYRLSSATGRERKPVNPDDACAGTLWLPYTRNYLYDKGNNLIEIRHSNTHGGYKTELDIDESSNRAVVRGGNTGPGNAFLAGGLQKKLSDGRQLCWYANGHLRQVSPVIRSEGIDDTECYYYGDEGVRVRKIRTTTASGGELKTMNTYTGDVERRSCWLADKLQRDMSIVEGEGVRFIINHVNGEIHQRYAFTDHLGSHGGETDNEGWITSREEYYPYGGSAGVDEECEEVYDRTRRFSGKERDATGLTYYGWRYYMPDTGRWLSADPGGLIDGYNLFTMCGNNPVNYFDTDGRNKNRQTPLLSSSFREKSTAFTDKNAWDLFLVEALKQEEREAGTERGNWDPRNEKERIATGLELYKQIPESGERRAFIGRMGQERSHLLSDKQKKKGVLNSAVWSLKLNDVFIQGGIDIGATFYLWNKMSDNERQLIHNFASKQQGCESLRTLLDNKISKKPDSELPVLGRAPRENETTEFSLPSVTAREIAQLLTGGYIFEPIPLTSSIHKEKKGESEKITFPHRFKPSAALRQSLSIKQHIVRMRSAYTAGNMTG
ncbi:RHS repeat-associated core domain-containing protein [Enterobacter chuandaensis]